MNPSHPVILISRSAKVSTATRLFVVAISLVISATLTSACTSTPTQDNEATESESSLVSKSQSTPVVADQHTPETEHEVLLRDSVTLLDNLSGTLEFVEDEETAWSVRPDMDDLVAQMHTLKSKRQQLGRIPSQIKHSSQFTTRYLQMMNSWSRFAAHAGRLAQNPGAMVHLRDPIQELLLFFDDITTLRRSSPQEIPNSH